MRTGSSTRRFLDTKLRALKARAQRLNRLTPRRIGLRPEDLPYAPSRAHFHAANKRLATIGNAINRQIAIIERNWPPATAQAALTQMALLDRSIDRLRRSFGMFFEVMSQRGSGFAPALAAHDAIALDCYTVVRAALPGVFAGPLLKPLTYMEHGYSPATQRRGVALARLLGDSNPFPVIRVPWDRDNPWQSVFLHEVAHNLQADMGLWQENAQAVGNRLASMRFDPLVVTILRRWHKEIFADLAALLLGGTASVWGMMEFLAHPGARALTYRPGGAHPTGWIRVLILTEMLRRMGFAAEAARAERVWRALYNPSRGHRLPPVLLASVPRLIPAVVDEIAYQPRRGLGQHALADAIPFTRADEARIRRGGIQIAAGHVPDLPPRFLVSASRFALEAGAEPDAIAKLVIRNLAQRQASRRPAEQPSPAALVA
ncbi:MULTISPECIES: hypothetical protein [unclassified Mesorhizobium]|uniref:hypothetical protein n=1 Tax=unclassified Mesorhizobium TaxID=325217 RepID=UPI000FD5A5B9|nr:MULTISPECIES: hypothetical protein [unclassified Mesorhizobium]RVD50204.1 hypothetical protein EN746_18815 [Mesorhizobium sp. M8A.F.Ca.ET.023.02.2.1]RWC73071.1 MAG: hypothetical protein EOS30_14675 [Mesorhizobium sp.]TGV15267.1 hypothetical protein EN816_07595 [Mesorhizobium sp. M8A.F.Ca.ET.173.01.1.1]RWC74284.1 MAG: hypothetical protein EOS71_14450 [Mesorhizobium sp.]TGQ01264.1 hypothetical protein EN861_00630 [Mesorhizobium sp. M8A.F.Ca.ET.218.01.1.1]